MPIGILPTFHRLRRSRGEVRGCPGSSVSALGQRTTTVRGAQSGWMEPSIMKRQSPGDARLAVAVVVMSESPWTRRTPGVDVDVFFHDDRLDG